MTSDVLEALRWLDKSGRENRTLSEVPAAEFGIVRDFCSGAATPVGP